MDVQDTTVIDDTDNHRFVFAEDGVDAELVYRVSGKRLILVHTEVPAVFRGRGIGGRLVKAAADRAAETGETVVPWCPYARKWLQDHPDVVGGLTLKWSDPPA